jgi:hypothetical protein
MVSLLPRVAIDHAVENLNILSGKRTSFFEAGMTPISLDTTTDTFASSVRCETGAG